MDFGDLGDELAKEAKPLIETNPYGPLLVAALKRSGLDVVYGRCRDEDFIWLNRGRFDVLHLHWPYYDYVGSDRPSTERLMWAFVNHLRSARDLGYRIVWTAHNIYPHDRTYHDLNHAFRVELCRIASAVIVHCGAAADEVRQRFGRDENVFVIPHGHFIGTHVAGSSRAEARAELGIPDDVFVYGLFGSIAPYKGIEELIDAFAALSGDPWLVISGQGRGTYARRIEMRIRGRRLTRVVYRTFQEFAPGHELTRVLAAADACPVPFRAATTSGSLILALSWGRPIVAPALGCIPETILPGAGIVYEPEEPGALAQALNDVRALDLVAASAAALASVARFGWDEVAVRTIEAYRAQP